MNNSEPQILMSPDVFMLFDAVSLIASLASLILAVIAIWLTISFKRDADKINRETNKLLSEIETESKSITQGVMSELKAYGDSMRGAVCNNTSENLDSATKVPEDFNVKLKDSKESDSN